MHVSRANGSLTRLVELGRRQGELAAQDLREALPIDRMSDEELARTIAYLEEEGVEVTLEPDLLAPRPRSAPEVREAAAPNRRVHSLKTDIDALDYPRRDIPHLQSDPPAHRRFATLSVFVAGLIVCAVVAVLVWVLS
ncbi:RNA polymerase sigma factor region1.1 domain-containing protein [Bradyrhizobium guangdongense]